MPQSAPTSRPRMSGGFSRQGGIGDFGEHLDEQALQQATQQKALTQQSTTQQQSVQQGQGGHKAQQDLTAAQAPDTVGHTPSVKPRALGTVTEELVTRPGADILRGLASIFDINALLGINAQEDPQTQAKKQQLHQRWQRLTEQEQQVAQQQYQAELQKKKAEEEEKERQKQEEERQKAQSIAPPSSPQKGPVGPAGSGKQRAVTKLEQDRKTLSGPASAN